MLSVSKISCQFEKSKTLSLGGVFTLIKVVLSSLHTYYFLLFKGHVCIIETIDKIRRRFLWAGSENTSKINWFSWSKVLDSKCDGGSRVGSLKAQNNAFLFKWRWKVRNGEHSLWKDIIGTIHNIHNKPANHIAEIP